MAAACHSLGRYASHCQAGQGLAESRHPQAKAGSRSLVWILLSQRVIAQALPAPCCSFAALPMLCAELHSGSDQSLALYTCKISLVIHHHQLESRICQAEGSGSLKLTVQFTITSCLLYLCWYQRCIAELDRAYLTSYSMYQANAYPGYLCMNQTTGRYSRACSLN